ncbi:glycosyltransferase family 4 protein [Actinoplanes regularis]|uniref:Glycosyltransferase involved in cell wall bisynthesis n=1 Tax=Actinoplanes regularis TaxID=52697 RepID=A0A238X714_9ACTN|nr:glycosyltransferase [Actinoplanes regularis]GIE86483.1 hypothetical protein Are01nite_29630 [Actinoplanes regularis]SNR54343.1 Glycosyltransferase involved in cell wall bisynthesis [Actinoplanes regularis]
MNVLLATPYYPPNLGGVQQYVANLARMLQTRHDYRVVVVTTADPGSPASKQTDADGITVYRLPVRGQISQTPLGLGWVRAIRRIIRDEKIDLVNGHGPVPLFADAARQAAGDLPFVLTYHGGRMRKGRLAPDTICAVYEHTVLAATARRAQQVICGSRYIVEEFPDLFAGRAEVIEPGADMRRFRPTPVPAEQRIVFAASLEHTTAYKALPDLLRAVVALPTAHLEVLGSGSALGDYQELAAELGISDRVTFAGKLGGEELAAAYRRGRVFVLPTHFDSFPTAIIEAMASGRPVVSTRVGSIPALVADGVSGSLVEAGDIDDLAAKIQVLLSDDELAARFGAAGAAFVAANLTWQRQAERTVEVFQRALDRRRTTTVAVVAPYYPPKVGGVENYAARVAQATAAAPAARAVVLTSNTTGVRTKVELDGDVPVIRLGTWARLSNTPLNPLWPFLVRRWLHRLKVDVVNGHAPVPGLADFAVFAAGRRPTVLTYHAGSMRKGTKADLLVGLYEKLALPRLFARANVVVPVSPTSLASGERHAVAITPGVDITLFTPGPAPSERQPTVLYVGRIDRTSAWKGLDVLLRAIGTVPGARLRVIGDGDATEDHRRIAAELGIADRVDFAGELRGSDLVAAMQQAAVLVLPSLTPAESFGMVLIEAMACGTPVIGSAVGGIPHVITDEVTGLLVPPGDHDALAAACRRVLSDPQVADRLGRSGREQAVKCYDWAHLTDRYLGIFEDLAPARTTPAGRP